MRTCSPELSVATRIVDYLKTELVDLEAQGKLKLSEQIHLPSEELIDDALTNLGVYHAKRPLVKTKKSTLASEDFKLLYFYHNRLDDYNIVLTKASFGAQEKSELTSKEAV